MPIGKQYNTLDNIKLDAIKKIIQCSQLYFICFRYQSQKIPKLFGHFYTFRHLTKHHTWIQNLQLFPIAADIYSLRRYNGGVGVFIHPEDSRYNNHLKLFAKMKLGYWIIHECWVCVINSAFCLRKLWASLRGILLFPFHLWCVTLHLLYLKFTFS